MKGHIKKVKYATTMAGQEFQNIYLQVSFSLIKIVSILSNNYFVMFLVFLARRPGTLHE